MKRILLATLLIASGARANVWRHAIETGKPDPIADKYEFEMKSGDEQTMQANARGITYREVKEHVRKAAEAYRTAALVKPDEAEPYYRLGMLLQSFYFECTGASAPSASILCSPKSSSFDTKHAEEVIAAWDAFEKRAPLDPRLSVNALGDSQILLERAILHTKIGTKEHLTRATEEYEKIISRMDSADNAVDDTIWSNLAETYMMLDRLDDAIDTYREALRHGAKAETSYGYAVALDRDEHAAQALDVIVRTGEGSRTAFYNRFNDGLVFYVPVGEEYYYFALVDEAFGYEDTAISFWQLYIKSGAHPEFQPRAKQHLDSLLKQRNKRPNFKLPLPFPDEIFR
jgi:tetratricopeptide (TPR) repeat protein